MTNVMTDHEALLERFQAVAEGTRLRIVQLLSGGERCVCDLQDELDAAQSRLSFHLKKLKDAGVVRDERKGRWVYYSLVPEALEEMRSFLGAVEPGLGGGGAGRQDSEGCGPGCCCGA